MAQETLRDILSPGERAVTVEMIQKTVADHFHMRVQELKSKNNSQSVTLPRQICMYLCKKLTGTSLPYIGREFGNKHHTTVLHSITKIEQLRQTDKDLNRLVESLLESFK
jgi:chromosomal replication initiator protein